MRLLPAVSLALLLSFTAPSAYAQTLTPEVVAVRTGHDIGLTNTAVKDMGDHVYTADGVDYQLFLVTGMLDGEYVQIIMAVGSVDGAPIVGEPILTLGAPPATPT